MKKLLLIVVLSTLYNLGKSQSLENILGQKGDATLFVSVLYYNGKGLLCIDSTAKAFVLPSDSIKFIDKNGRKNEILIQFITDYHQYSICKKLISAQYQLGEKLDNDCVSKLVKANLDTDDRWLKYQKDINDEIKILENLNPNIIQLKLNKNALYSQKLPARGYYLFVRSDKKKVENDEIESNGMIRCYFIKITPNKDIVEEIKLY